MFRLKPDYVYCSNFFDEYECFIPFDFVFPVCPMGCAIISLVHSDSPNVTFHNITFWVYQKNQDYNG